MSLMPRGAVVIQLQLPRNLGQALHEGMVVIQEQRQGTDPVGDEPQSACLDLNIVHHFI